MGAKLAPQKLYGLGQVIRFDAKNGSTLHNIARLHHHLTADLLRIPGPGLGQHASEAMAKRSLGATGPMGPVSVSVGRPS